MCAPGWRSQGSFGPGSAHLEGLGCLDMRIVIALGGNAVLQRGESPDSEIQQHHLEVAVGALSPLAEGNDVVVTYGDGPQVGLLAVENANDPALSRPFGFDVLGAQAQGMIGYWLLQALENELPTRAVASLITQTLVSAADPAFGAPTKFVGPVYTEAQARDLSAARGWVCQADGSGWRRVVASPTPHRIVETRLIRQLLEQGVIVVCAGGGGAPVVRNEHGRLQGVDAVVDKDATTAALAEALDADVLLLLTDVPAVQVGYGTPDASPITRATPAALRSHTFPDGSMGPKVAATCRFVEMTGGMAAIGALADTEAILAGDAGTIVTSSGCYPERRRP
jgi:carbamate kinase